MLYTLHVEVANGSVLSKPAKVQVVACQTLPDFLSARATLVANPCPLAGAFPPPRGSDRRDVVVLPGRRVLRPVRLLMLEPILTRQHAPTVHWQARGWRDRWQFVVDGSVVLCAAPSASSSQRTPRTQCFASSTASPSSAWRALSSRIAASSSKAAVAAAVAAAGATAAVVAEVRFGPFPPGRCRPRLPLVQRRLLVAESRRCCCRGVLFPHESMLSGCACRVRD